MIPLRRTKTGLLIDWGLIVFFLLLAGAFVVKGQDAKPTSICGMDMKTPEANTQLIQVSCVSFDKFRELAPEYPWPAGKVTQVLVHAREGDVVRVTVGTLTQYADLSRDAWGRLVALVQFDGVEHTDVSVKVYRAVEP